MIFSLFHLWTETRNWSISERDTESRELSKNRIVKNKNPVMISPSMMTARAGLKLKMTHERMSPKSDPIPKVILFLAKIVPYSLGFA